VAVLLRRLRLPVLWLRLFLRRSVCLWVWARLWVRGGLCLRAWAVLLRWVASPSSPLASLVAAHSTRVTKPAVGNDGRLFFATHGSVLSDCARNRTINISPRWKRRPEGSTWGV